MGWSAESAVEEMRRYGWSPDEDTVLIEYLNENMDFIAGSLVDAEVIEPPSPMPVFGSESVGG